MKRAVAGLLAGLLAITSSALAGNPGPLTLEASIALPEVKGRIDHITVDLKGQRLFVAAVENHTLEVVDLRSGHRVRTIADLVEPQGVFYDQATNRLFVACVDGAVKVFDGTTFKVQATTRYPVDADNLRYNAREKGVIVGYAGAKQLRNRAEGAGGLGFLDAEGRKIGDVVIDAHPESFQLEQVGGRLFVNVPDKREIEVIDAAQRVVVARWPVTSAQDNFPMALDEAHHRLFVATMTPARLLTFNTDSGKEVGSTDIAGAADDIFYDADKARLYVLSSAGFLEVFQKTDADHLARIARYPTPPRTATGLFVPEWGKLFAAVQNQAGHSAEIRVYATK